MSGTNSYPPPEERTSEEERAFQAEVQQWSAADEIVTPRGKLTIKRSPLHPKFKREARTMEQLCKEREDAGQPQKYLSYQLSSDALRSSFARRNDDSKRTEDEITACVIEFEYLIGIRRTVQRIAEDMKAREVAAGIHRPLQTYIDIVRKIKGKDAR